MRSKRKQKRTLKLQKTTASKETKGLPDPFSANNSDLVEAELELADMCPCCIDRAIEIELNKQEREYLEWLQGEEKK